MSDKWCLIDGIKDRLDIYLETKPDGEVDLGFPYVYRDGRVTDRRGRTVHPHDIRFGDYSSGQLGDILKNLRGLQSTPTSEHGKTKGESPL
jgi:hypothetical protein